MYAFKKKTENFVLFLFLFLLVFQPPLISFSMTYILLGAMLAYIFLRKKIAINFSLFKPLFGFLPFILYLLFSTMIRILFSESEEFIAAYSYNLKHVMQSALFLLVSVVFLYTFKKHRKEKISGLLEEALIIVGIMQLACAILAVFSPAVHDCFLNLLSANAKNDIITQRSQHRGYRIYIFSNYVFDLGGYICALLVSVAFVKGISERSKKYIILSLLFLIIPIFNARSGIILSAIAMLVVLLFYMKNWNAKRILRVISVVLIIALGLLIIIRLLPDFNREWIIQGLSQTYQYIFSQDSSGTFSQIASTDIVYPKNLVFGLGARPETLGYFAKDGSYIDNGYIQSVWRFGLFGSILLFIGIVYYFIYIYVHTSNEKTKILCICMLVLVLSYHVKTYPMTIHGANFITFAFPILLLSEEEKYSLYSPSNNRNHSG